MEQTSEVKAITSSESRAVGEWKSRGANYLWPSRAFRRARCRSFRHWTGCLSGYLCREPGEGGFSQFCGHNLPSGHLINYFLQPSPLATLKEERDRDKEMREERELDRDN